MVVVIAVVVVVIVLIVAGAAAAVVHVFDSKLSLVEVVIDVSFVITSVSKWHQRRSTGEIHFPSGNNISRDVSRLYPY